MFPGILYHLSRESSLFEQRTLSFLASALEAHPLGLLIRRVDLILRHLPALYQMPEQRVGIADVRRQIEPLSKHLCGVLPELLEQLHHVRHAAAREERITHSLTPPRQTLYFRF